MTRCGILFSQKNKLWLIKAVDKATGKMIAWELGNRNTETFQRLYDKVQKQHFIPIIGMFLQKFFPLKDT